MSPEAESAFKPSIAKVAVVLVLLGAPVLGWIGRGPYIWTDVGDIGEGGVVPQSLSHLIQAVTGGLNDHYYRPTIFTINAINSWLLGDSPFAFRIVNVFLHFTNGLLVYMLARRVSVSNGYGSITAAALFLVHPLAVTPLSWISDRTDLIALGAAAGTSCAAMAFINTGLRRYLLLALGVFIVGLGAKEHVAMCLICGGLLLARSRGPTRVRCATLTSAGMACVVIYFAWSRLA